MSKIELPFFGIIDTENVASYTDVTVNFQGKEISIDLNFDQKTTTSQVLNKCKAFLEQLDAWEKQNQSSIDRDYLTREYDTVKEYLEHHLEEIPEYELFQLIDKDNQSKSYIEQLREKLSLKRLGLYPEQGKSFATFDYSIGVEITQYLVVIVTDENGVLQQMMMES